MDRAARLRAFALAAAALAVVAALVALPVREAAAAMIEWTEGRGAWTGMLLVAIWVPAALLAIPGSVITLATGFALGLGWGVVVVSIGSTLGAAAAFLAGRTVARDRVRRRIADRPRFRALDRAVREEGLRIVLLARLSPLFPYNFQNYAWGVSGIGFGEYLLGSWLGMLPATILYVYLGSGARTVAAAAAGEGARSPAETALFAIGLVATILVVALVARAARRALEREAGMEEAR